MNNARSSRLIAVMATDGPMTQTVQAALDVAQHEPVHIRLEAGTHLCQGLRLWSDTVLELAEGATLQFQPSYDAYADTTVAVEAEQSDRAMIVASNAQRITLCGQGRIHCDGSDAFSLGDDAVMGTRIPHAKRPRVMVLDGCRDVTLRDIAVLDSPMWTLHFVDCDGLQLRDLTIDNDRRMPNTDGVVIDGCRDVSIIDCEIRTADDGVVLKTSARLDGSAAAPCRDITVADCVIESRSCALKLGTESFADFTNITFQRCKIEASNRALGIFSRDGGAVDGVRFADITLDCHETPDGFWGSGEPVTITVLDRRPEVAPAGTVRNVDIRHVSGRSHGAVNMFAERPGMIADVTLNDITLDQYPGPLGTALRYDRRPTPIDLIPSDDAAGRVNAWRLGEDGKVIGLTDYPGGFPAVFAHNVDGLHLSDLRIIRPTPLPEGWAAELVTQTRD